jgi:diguanylate cyclase
MYAPPRFMNYIWAALILLLVVEAVAEISGIGGPRSVYAGWIQNGLFAASAAVILARALYVPTDRAAWLAIGLATVSWLIGSVGWSLAYGGRANPPFPTFADIFWLLWYPLMAFGLFRLIQSRLQKFSWHRWMDGVAVMLVVLTAGVALIIEPAADAGVQGPMASIIDFSYPVLDVIMIGAIIGVYGLLGWRPDRMWILLGSGIVLMAIADSVYAVQEVGGVAGDTRYSFLWTTGAVLIAYAAWVRVPGVRNAPVEITGLRAVALPLIAQALAVAIQLYAFFGEVARGERLVTVAVLVVSSIQIILTRPRPHSTDSRVMPATTERDRKEEP